MAAAWTAVAVALLLVAERTRSRIGVWIAKPAASLGFVAFAWQSAHTGAYADSMRAGLIACALGDVLLIPAGAGPTFLAGTAAFAIGHACYAWAFWTRDPVVWVSAIGAVVMLLVARATLRWLRPHLLPPLAAAVRGYIAVIAIMVALSAGATAATGDARIAAGALAFALSDLSVARDRFVKPGFDNVLWGLPLYYAAQLVLAWTI